MKENRKRAIRWSVGLIAACLLAPPLSATTVIPIDPFSGYYTGTFDYDNDLVFFSFSIADPDTRLYIQTISWAQTGGFTPELTLFSASGVNQGIGGPSSIGIAPDCGPRGTDLSGACLDAFIDAVLQPGDYLLALSQAGNEAQGNLSDGFLYDPANFDVLQSCTSANFTSNAEGCLALGGPSGTGNFYTPSGAQLNGTWALAVGTPEPSPGFLMLSGLAALAGFSRLRARRSSSFSLRAAAAQSPLNSGVDA